MNDSGDPGFWDKRYANERMPWDFGDVPAALSEFVQRVPPGKVLIPGCGTGYEVQAFARSGWTVDAVDFSAGELPFRERSGCWASSACSRENSSDAWTDSHRHWAENFHHQLLFLRDKAK